MTRQPTMTTQSLKATLRAEQERIRAMAEGVPMQTFQPLRSWPAREHPRQSEIDAFREIPSRWSNEEAADMTFSKGVVK